jgi:hypothetical protein
MTKIKKGLAKTKRVWKSKRHKPSLGRTLPKSNIKNVDNTTTEAHQSVIADQHTGRAYVIIHSNTSRFLERLHTSRAIHAAFANQQAVSVTSPADNGEVTRHADATLSTIESPLQDTAHRGESCLYKPKLNASVEVILRCTILNNLSTIDRPPGLRFCLEEGAYERTRHPLILEPSTITSQLEVIVGGGTVNADISMYSKPQVTLGGKISYIIQTSSVSRDL